MFGNRVDGAGVDHVHDGPRRVERELVQPHRMLRQRQRVRRHRRVQQHVGAPAVQFGHQRVERRVAEVDARRVGREDDAVEAEHVERIGQLGQRAVDVRQRQHREAAEAPRLPLDLRRDQLVHPPREVVGETLVAEPHTGRRQQQDRGVDRVPRHQRVQCLLRPRREREAEQVAALELPPVVGGQHVGVRVDPRGHRAHAGLLRNASTPTNWPGNSARMCSKA